MTTQTSYSNEHAAAFAGMVATQYPFSIATGVVEDAAGIGFGKPVVVGAADGGITVPNAAGENLYLGITCRNPAAPLTATAFTADVNPDGSNAPYLTRGEIWVTVGTNVVPGDPVYIRETDAVFLKAAATNVTALPNAKYMTTAASGALAKVRIG